MSRIVTVVLGVSTIANLLLPLNAMLIAAFAGWMMTRQSLLEELGVRSVALARFLNIVLRYVAPALIFAILLDQFDLN